MATQIDLGAVVPIGKGDWNSSITYERANIVRHNSTAWVCKVATSKGVEPSESSSDWYLLVKDISAVTSVNGMRGDVTVDSILTNPSTDDNSLKIASTSWVKTKVDNVVDGVNTELSQVSSTASTALQTANTADVIANNALSKAVAAEAVLPAGFVIAFAANSNPSGYLLCNGAAVSRTTYAALFAAIGTTYGAGDGSTTFNLPNLMGKVPWGSTSVGTVLDAGLPNITGGAATPDSGGIIQWLTIGNRWGAIDAEIRPLSNYPTVGGGDFQHTVGGFNIDASRSSKIYGKSSTVQPPALTMRYYIKY